MLCVIMVMVMLFFHFARSSLFSLFLCVLYNFSRIYSWSLSCVYCIIFLIRLACMLCIISLVGLHSHFPVCFVRGLVLIVVMLAGHCFLCTLIPAFRLLCVVCLTNVKEIQLDSPSCTLYLAILLYVFVIYD